jgi:hypothetical protein
MGHANFIEKLYQFNLWMLQMRVRAHRSAPLQKLMCREICLNRY